MTNVTAGAYADLPLFLFHLLEYLDIDYEVNIGEINERWSREASVNVWSQIIIKETGDQVELLTRAPRTGIYRLGPDGTTAFRRWGNDWHGIVSESEAFYLRILAAGDYRYHGADMGALVTRGRLQTDDNRLEERCKQSGRRPAGEVRRRAAGPAATPAGQPACVQDGLTVGRRAAPARPAHGRGVPGGRRRAAAARGLGSRWRFASIELIEPDAQAAHGTGAPSVRKAQAVCWNRDDGQAYRAVVCLAAATVEIWEHLPGQQPNITVDEWSECDEMLPRHTQLVAALARRGITDPARVLTDVWAYRAHNVPAVPRPAARLGGRLVPRRPGRKPLRPPRHRAAPHRGPQPHGTARTRRQPRPRGPRRAARRQGRVPAKAPARPAADGEPAGREPAGGRLVPHGRQGALVAELADADRLQPPGGAGPARGGVSRRRPAPAGRAPALVRRDDRALPGHHR